MKPFIGWMAGTSIGVGFIIGLNIKSVLACLMIGIGFACLGAMIGMAI